MVDTKGVPIIINSEAKFHTVYEIISIRSFFSKQCQNPTRDLLVLDIEKRVMT